MTPGSPSRSAGETSGAPAGLTTLPPAHTAAIIGVSSSTLLDEKLEADNPGWRADEELWLNAPVSPHVLVVSLLRMPVSLCKEPRGNPTNEDEEEAAGGGGSASHSSRALVSKKRCAGSYSPSADDEESDASTFDGNDSPLASEDKTLGTTGPSTGKYKLPALKLYPRKESRSSEDGSQDYSVRLKIMEEYVHDLEARLAASEERVAAKGSEITMLKERIDELQTV